MLIRSQDKEVLCECTEVNLEEENNNCYQIINDNDWILGEYTTKEKAIKVLDMIQTHLENLEYKVSGREVIFQMPLDRDVW